MQSFVKKWESKNSKTFQTEEAFLLLSLLLLFTKKVYSSPGICANL